MGCSLGALKSKHRSASNSSPIVNGRLGPRCSRNAVQEAYLEHRLEMDDRCPLSDRQLYTLMKSWKAISRNMSQTAINMFVRMFETNQNIKGLFLKLKDARSIHELRTSKLLEAHALKVIHTIDDALMNFDDMDYVLAMLTNVARSHSRFLHFEADVFWHLEQPFLLAVQEELGDRFSISIETTYRTFIRFILSTLVTKFNAFSLTPSPSTNLISTSASSTGTGTHVRQNQENNSSNNITLQVQELANTDLNGNGCK